MIPDLGTAVSATELGTACCSCLLRHGCPPCGLAGLQTQPQQPLMFSRQRVLAGQPLYREGEAFQRIHAVRSGSLKSSMTLPGGQTQVSGFHLPGDVVGLDAVADDCHPSTATALEDTQTCAVAYGPLLALSSQLPVVQQDLTRLMSRQTSAAQWHLLLLGSMTAAERVAALLLDLSHRAASHGQSPSEFNLRMTRADIGSYLSITAETVCRVLQGFKALKLLDVDSRHIRFLDLPAFTQTYSASINWRPRLHAAMPNWAPPRAQVEAAGLAP